MASNPPCRYIGDNEASPISLNPSLSLTEHQQRFIAELVESGRYHGPSEVFLAGLRLLEEREEQRKALVRRLEAETRAGLDSGPAAPLEPMADLIAEARRGP